MLNLKVNPEKMVNHNSHLCFTHGILPKKGGGVYKLLFDTGYFYIGSTKDFKTRINVYRAEFRKEIYNHSKKMNEVIKNSTNVIFEVLEVIDVIDEARFRENFYLNELKEDALIINRAKTAYSTKGVKWSKEEIEKARMTSLQRGRRKRGKGKKTLALLQ